MPIRKMNTLFILAVWTLADATNVTTPCSTAEGRNTSITCEPGTIIINRLRRGVIKKTYCYYCPSGFFSRETNSLKCSVCPAGKTSSRGSSVCTDCQPGSYADKSGSMKCTLCPGGKWTSVKGSSTCEGSLCNNFERGHAGSVKKDTCVTCEDRIPAFIGLFIIWASFQLFTIGLFFGPNSSHIHDSSIGDCCCRFLIILIGFAFLSWICFVIFLKAALASGCIHIPYPDYVDSPEWAVWIGQIFFGFVSFALLYGFLSWAKEKFCSIVCNKKKKVKIVHITTVKEEL